MARTITTIPMLLLALTLKIFFTPNATRSKRPLQRVPVFSKLEPPRPPQQSDTHHILSRYRVQSLQTFEAEV